MQHIFNFILLSKNKEVLGEKNGVAPTILVRLRNLNTTDDGNVDFRSFKKKFYIQSLGNKYKVVDLLVQKLLNDITLDRYPPMNSSLHTRQTWDEKCFCCQSCTFVLLRT